ncbi:MAG: hypothetical protein WA151_21510 [Desulfatirhabdiaceae bacterium]
MNDLILPVIVGVLVFAISQYFLKLILEPILCFRKVLSEISNTLLFNQGIITCGTAENEILMRKIHELSASLRSSVYMIPFYNFLYKARIFGLPKRENILLSCRKLNVLSYGVNVSKNGEGKCLVHPSEIAQKNENILIEIAQLLPIETTYMLENEKNP